MQISPIERFSSRVEAYIKYRPSYPLEIINYLKTEAGLSSDHIVADIGSGTGFLSKLFLDNGNAVFGVEPNNPMREAAEKWLSFCAKFRSISGRAEKTSLDNDSIDFITAGQAFHWFEPEPTKKEFFRIAREEAKLVLVWNRRNLEDDALQIEYERILRNLAPEYIKVNHKNIDDKKIVDFVEPSPLQKKSFDHFQLFDFESLIGRLLSSSYCPDEESDSFKEIKRLLLKLFEKHEINGKVRFNYRADVYWAEIVKRQPVI